MSRHKYTFGFVNNAYFDANVAIIIIVVEPLFNNTKTRLTDHVYDTKKNQMFPTVKIQSHITFFGYRSGGDSHGCFAIKKKKIESTCLTGSYVMKKM